MQKTKTYSYRGYKLYPQSFEVNRIRNKTK